MADTLDGRAALDARAVAGGAGRDRRDPMPAAPEAPVWPNVHAPDAARATTARVAGDRPRGSRRVVRLFLLNPSALVGLAVLGLAVALALAAPLLFPAGPLHMAGRPFQWPGQNPAFPLGTDVMGRDVLAGIAYGARTSLLIGLSATLIGLTLGVGVGAVSGYFDGLPGDVLVRVIEFFQTLPHFIILVVIVAIAGPSIASITLAIGIVTWPAVARLVRAEFRSLREKDFVLAARSLGYGDARIIFREILPNALPPVIVTSSIMVASAILMESALSFMGLGDPNTVSWGSMIGAGREMLRTHWYLTAIPGLAIVAAVLAFNLIGDALNDALNPRLHVER